MYFVFLSRIIEKKLFTVFCKTGKQATLSSCLFALLMRNCCEVRKFYTFLWIKLSDLKLITLTDFQVIHIKSSLKNGINFNFVLMQGQSLKWIKSTIL